MPNTPRRPILYKGEAYSSPLIKKASGPPKEPAISFDEARSKIITDINSLREQLPLIDSKLKLPNETILSFRVLPEYAAKSYYPSSLFYPANQGSGLQEIGSRLWRLPNENDAEEEAGFAKLFYIRATSEGLDRFINRLSQPSGLPENFQLDIRRMAKVELINSSERLSGFETDWVSGNIEVTLHPFSLDRTHSLSHFKSLISENGGALDNMRLKQYDNEGLTFISFKADKNIIGKLADYNPLRSAHPIGLRPIPKPQRSASPLGSPAAPAFTSKSSLVVGVLDGGYVTGNSAIDPYVEVIDSVSGPADPDFADHGTEVTAAVLYGALNEYRSTDTLPEPEVSVRNFRVISQTQTDPELYDVIDAIEKIVPANPDIQVYNLSLGPVGPIIDSDIHRFTYALDRLSKLYNVLFSVAVGNDGEVVGYDRIQSPADMVNGIGVGAYSLFSGKPERASYSCSGPGREGNKLKPDISAFGGCERMPIQLLNAAPGTRSYTLGSSFASPITAGFLARLIGKSNGVVGPLSARALVLHQSRGTENEKHCLGLGHGILPNDLDEMMNCIDKSYTLIFEGELERTKHREFQIPWLSQLKEGKVNLRWAVAVLTSVDPNSPEDYTTSSVEIGFYPNSHKFVFTDPTGKKTKRIDVQEKPKEAEDLLAKGWTQSNVPASETSPKQFQPEGELRKELKWDTVDVRVVPKLAKSIKDPIFQVHAIGRGHRSAGEKVKFVITLTVEAKAATIDLYGGIVANYPALLPIEMVVPVPVLASVSA
ncbi:MAG: S8 family peptidase [Bacteroidota bacterium]